MFETQTLITYLAASVAIILAPGPAQALVLTRSLSDGRKSGVMTALGLNVGTIFHAIAAALGLSAILASSAVAFATLKYLGGKLPVLPRNQSASEKTTSNHGNDYFKVEIAAGIRTSRGYRDS